MIFIRPVVAATDRELATAAFPGGIVFQGFRNRAALRDQSYDAIQLFGGIHVYELAELVKELTGSQSALVHRPLPEDDPRQRKPDIARAEAELNWRPTVALRDGLARTIAYFDALLSDAA